MKRCAELDTDVTCPNCGRRSDLGGPLPFQWGKIPHSYRAGDRIVWLKNKAGEVVPPFQLVGPGGLWNCGDPSIVDLYVFNGDPNVQEFKCSQCGVIFESVAARIVDGVVRGATAFLPGEVERTFGATLDVFDIAVLRPDGTYEPRLDLYDAPFSEYKE
jgi:rubredoxin